VKLNWQRRHTIETLRTAASSKTLGISTANKDIPENYNGKDIYNYQNQIQRTKLLWLNTYRVWERHTNNYR